MRAVSWGLIASLVLFGAYSCHRYATKRERASGAVLARGEFKPAGPLLRVSLTIPGECMLGSRGPIRISFPGTEEPEIEIAATAELARFEGGKLLWGTREFPRRIRCSPGGAALTINDRPYAGVIELIPDPEKPLIINELTCEEYLLGVVGHEMRSDFEFAALRAQAIASRTYALYKALFRREGEWHLSDTTLSQVYQGGADVPSRVRRAVAETCGLILTYDGKVFQSYYHSTCGGNTTQAQKYFREPEILPLGGVTCIFCRGPDPEKPLSPLWSWVAEYNERAARQALASHPAVRDMLDRAKVKLGRITAIEPIRDARPADLYPEYFRVVHENGSFEILALTLRSILNGLGPKQTFLSPAVTLCELRGEILRIEGRGWGHGVGMCQYGAEGQAIEGFDFFSILMFYYPGARLVRAWSRDLAETAVAARRP